VREIRIILDAVLLYIADELIEYKKIMSLIRDICSERVKINGQCKPLRELAYTNENLFIFAIRPRRVRASPNFSKAP
jgi:hypothetical protein